MRSLEETLQFLRGYLDVEARLERDRKDIVNSNRPQDFRDERDREIKELIEKNNAKMFDTLVRLVTFPPHHVKHQKQLMEFQKVAPFEKSLFIMTKFPNAKNPTPLDKELILVIDTVNDAITACGHFARIAFDKDYYPSLWDNVELHLLGCAKGIAIVESKYLPELNPNVAMEWGWMRGMGRNVLYLVEQSFDKQRANWSGLIEYSFDWNNPVQDIQTAIGKWLKK